MPIEPHEIRVTTSFNADHIEQTEQWPGDDIHTSMMKRVMDLREQGVRDALVRLGWTPPPGAPVTRNRLRRWLCDRFGHRPHYPTDYPDMEVCRRCNRLLSTPYSRARRR